LIILLIYQGIKIDQLAVISIEIQEFNFDAFQSLCAFEESFWRMDSPLRLIDYNQVAYIIYSLVITIFMIIEF